MRTNLICSILLVAGFTATPAFAKTGQEVLQQCASCHAITKPTDTSVNHLWERKAPDLYYAGVKYNRDWVSTWLQNPTSIRPAGVFYTNAIKASPDKSADTVDSAKLTPHAKLDKAEADAVADELMKLGPDLNLVQKGAFKGEAASPMAAMLFSKLRGCSSCHSAAQGNGGLSGPELADAGTRLQPDFVVAYINDPQKFDPHVWMPKLDLTDADVQKLTGYLMTLKQGAAK